METTCVFQVKRDVIHVRLIIYRIHNNIERVERCLAMGGDRGKKRVNDRLGFFLISSVLKALQLFLPPPHFSAAHSIYSDVPFVSVYVSVLFEKKLFRHRICRGVNPLEWNYTQISYF